MNNNKPHSRRKTVGSGTANVAKGRKLNTGSRPVGFAAGNKKTSGGRAAGKSSVNGFFNAAGGRPNGAGSRPAGYGARPSFTNTRPSGMNAFGQFHTGKASGNSYQKTGMPAKKLSFKTILILIVLAIIVMSASKFLSGFEESADYNSSYSNSYSNSYNDSYDSGYNNYGGSYNGGTNNSWNNGGGSVLTAKPTATAMPTATAKPASNGSQSGASSKRARARYYTPEAGDTVTIMLYMCGTDLESKNGMATNDLNEMLNARLSDKVNLIVETGGCKRWSNSTVSSSCNQIYKIGYKEISRLEDNFGTESMTDPDNLAKFIRYCKEKYPADRNILIFWDHGGGSISGYGYDEKYPNSGSMTLGKIDSALKKGGCKFDFIGFDACLMATLETDLICNNYADYIIASEETEPGTGWYYTNWLTKLSENTAIPTVELSRTIIDTYVSSCSSYGRSAQVTLSVVDLAQLDKTVPDALRDFAVSTSELINSGSYKRVSDARAGARQFAQSSRLNQIDIIDFAQRIGTKESIALADALNSCVKYNKSTISRSNGISMYFPYETTKTVNSAISTFNSIGQDDDYAECIGEYARCVQEFASLEYGGQITASASQYSGLSSGNSAWDNLFDALLSSGSSAYGSTSPIEVLTGGFSGESPYSTASAGYGMDISSIVSLLSGFSGRSMPAGFEWVDTDLIAGKAQSIAEQFVDPARMAASEKDGHKVLTLSDSEWERIQAVELNVFVGDGEGFIDLGLDNTFDWLDDQSLLLDYDGTWLTLNGNVCAYYLVSDTQQDNGSWVTVGRIPALLNGDLVNLQVVFDDAHPDGSVTGAYPLYADSGIDVQAKGDIEIVAGDTITPLCDYYDLNGDYSASYTLGDSFEVPNSGLSLENLSINADDLSVTYRLTDIYGNHFWVPVN